MPRSSPRGGGCWEQLELTDAEHSQAILFKKHSRLISAASPVNYPELSAYVIEEMKLLQQKIASLKKVTIKLEFEMRQAMEIKGQYI